jgi:hypothetical protein
MPRSFAFRPFFAALTCTVLAAGHAAAQTSPTPAPAKPGTFQLRAKAPEPDKWIAKRDVPTFNWSHPLGSSTIAWCKRLMPLRTQHQQKLQAI